MEVAQGADGRLSHIAPRMSQLRHQRTARTAREHVLPLDAAADVLAVREIGDGVDCSGADVAVGVCDELHHCKRSATR